MGSKVKWTECKVVLKANQAMSRMMKAHTKKTLFWEFLQAKVKNGTQLKQNKWSLSVWDEQSKDANTPTLAKKWILFLCYFFLPFFSLALDLILT